MSIIRLQSVLLAPRPEPAICTLVIRCHDEHYWCGIGRGVAGTGWSPDRADALEYASWSIAAQKRQSLKLAYPTMKYGLRNDEVRQ